MIFITAIISLGIGLALGGFFWGQYADAEERQAEEIAALQEENARVRSQASELAAQAHKAQVKGDFWHRTAKMFESRLDSEQEEHAASRRKLSAAKGQITKLRRRLP